MFTLIFILLVIGFSGYVSYTNLKKKDYWNAVFPGMVCIGLTSYVIYVGVLLYFIMKAFG